MAGAYRLAMSRARVQRDGQPDILNAQVTVRDGIVKAAHGREIVAEMPLVEMTQTGRRVYELVGPDETWLVSRKCNCGSR